MAPGISVNSTAWFTADATALRLPRLPPRYTATSNGTALPDGSNRIRPPQFACQRYQTECPPAFPAWFDSTGSLPASLFELTTVPCAPNNGWALEKSSFTGLAAKAAPEPGNIKATVVFHRCATNAMRFKHELDFIIVVRVGDFNLEIGMGDRAVVTAFKATVAPGRNGTARHRMAPQIRRHRPTWNWSSAAASR